MYVRYIHVQVQAFYGGQISYALSDDSNKESESNFDPVLPLIDAYTPNALRRRIFLDKLSKM